MATIYERMGLRRVINASGRMTVLGVSTIADETAAALVEAAQNYVVIDELIDKTGALISALTGAEDTCVTSCASAAICMSVAGVIAGTDITLVERVPDTSGLANEIILQKGHAVNFGGDVCQMLRIGGGVPVEVGCANRVSPLQIEGAITDKTAALFYVKSHHAVQKGMVSIEEMLEIAHRHSLPLIVDAAAEENITKYVSMGVDLVCYSGAKAFEGPTSGMVTGKAALIAAVKKQYKGIGRPMKVGKECMTGLVKALELYVCRDEAAAYARQQAIVDALLAGFSTLPHVKCDRSVDEAGRKICRAKLELLPDAPMTAIALAEALKAGTPSIHTRDHYSNLGILYFDPRPMLDGDPEAVIVRLRELLQG